MIMQQAGPGLAAVAPRRKAISAAGLAIAGAAGLGSAPRNRITFGATLGAYPKLNAAVPRAIGLRMYFDGENEFPSAWPVALPPGSLIPGYTCEGSPIALVPCRGWQLAKARTRNPRPRAGSTVPASSWSARIRPAPGHPVPGRNTAPARRGWPWHQAGKSARPTGALAVSVVG